MEVLQKAPFPSAPGWLMFHQQFPLLGRPGSCSSPTALLRTECTLYRVVIQEIPESDLPTSPLGSAAVCRLISSQFSGSGPLYSLPFFESLLWGENEDVY